MSQQSSLSSGLASAAAKLGGAGAKRTLAPPSPSPSVGSTTSAAAGGGTPRKERHDTPNVVYSQPVATGVGENIGTQLNFVIKWLREKDEPQTLDRVKDYLSMGRRSDKDLETFANQMRSSASIDWIPDPNLTEQTWRSGTYRHRALIPNVRNKEQLLGYLQKKPDASPVQVRELKDGWPDCEKAINELEAEHKLLVTRQKKDGAPKCVWLDDPSLFHEIDPKFKNMWTKVVLPGVENIVQQLEAVGQKATSEDPRLKAGTEKKVEKKKKKAKKLSKLANSHMFAKLGEIGQIKK
jgi:transcription initiation factor TFIIE subunit beta